MSRDKGNLHDAGEPRDWQKDNDRLEEIKDIFEAPGEIFYGSISEHDGEVSQSVEDASREFKWLIDQVDKLKEDNVRWLCKHTAAEQKYLTQSNVIAELRRREKKLKEALEHCVNQYPLWDSKEIACELMMDYMKNVLSILYPLDREEDKKKIPINKNRD